MSMEKTDKRLFSLDLGLKNKQKVIKRLIKLNVIKKANEKVEMTHFILIFGNNDC